MSAYQAVAADEPTRDAVDQLPGNVVLEFGAAWCPHCNAVQPTLKEQLDRRDDLKHVKVEDGAGKPLGRSFRVKLWPTLVFLQDGVEKQRLVRPSPEELRIAFESVPT